MEQLPLWANRRAAFQCADQSAVPARRLYSAGDSNGHWVGRGGVGNILLCATLISGPTVPDFLTRSPSGGDGVGRGAVARGVGFRRLGSFSSFKARTAETRADAWLRT